MPWSTLHTDSRGWRAAKVRTSHVSHLRHLTINSDINILQSTKIVIGQILCSFNVLDIYSGKGLGSIIGRDPFMYVYVSHCSSAVSFGVSNVTRVLNVLYIPVLRGERR